MSGSYYRPAKTVPPIHAAHLQLIMQIAGIRAPRIPIEPASGDFADVKEYAEAVTKAVDEWLLAVATEAAANSHQINETYFENFFTEQLAEHCLLEDFVTADERVAEPREPVVRWSETGAE